MYSFDNLNNAKTLMKLLEYTVWLFRCPPLFYIGVSVAFYIVLTIIP